ncbi:hypothetical protein NW752_008015 [Fusarium irregulare]|uniref:Uncharacterized protein n=1 Tax=Fusarium irregulare TaxID=2494466 RepID=A0A9W8UDF8_9HYPO|nr:hypothetical protein NW752_008015 [Fusarium irregulare]KAJ4019712.1 hypothetical protein NW766_003470 [Fusarium irregulare]
MKKAVDGRGNQIEAQISITPGMIAHIRDFAYDIKPRSEKFADLIRQVEIDHPWQKGDARFLDDKLFSKKARA